MAYLKWEEKYSVKIQEIDVQHKQLFEMIENFYEALREKQTDRAMAEILEGLAEYSTYHFHSEELLMEQHNYPGYKRHKAEHARFIETVGDFQDRFKKGHLVIPIEVADFLKTWLSHHILVVDQEYAPFFHEKGVK